MNSYGTPPNQRGAREYYIDKVKVVMVVPHT